jgi:CBS domain containing-hemolysin-like protein
LDPVGPLVRTGAIVVALLWARALMSYATALPHVRVQRLDYLSERKPGLARRIADDVESVSIRVAVSIGAVAVLAVAVGLLAHRLGADLAAIGEYSTASSRLMTVGVSCAVFILVAIVLPTVKTGRDALRTVVSTRFAVAPAMVLLSLVTRFAEAATSIGADSHQAEDDLTNLVADEDTLGRLQPDEREMIHSIFTFSDTVVREIMVPRIDVHTLPATSSATKAAEAFGSYGHTRLPLIGEDADEVVGVLYAKDLLMALAKAPNGTEIRLENIARDAYFVPETMNIPELLREFKKRRLHLAIAVDEYGGTAGLVALEDIIEEIVGEIEDEYDESGLTVRKIGPSVYLVRATANLGDVNDELGLSLPDDDIDTLGGFVYNLAGTTPKPGSIWRYGDVRFQVSAVEGQRIRVVKVHLPKATTTTHPGSEDEA